MTLPLLPVTAVGSYPKPSYLLEARRKHLRAQISKEALTANVRAFVDAIVETMVIKCRRAMQETGLRQLIAAGGVSANRQLRSELRKMVEQEGGSVFYPRPEFCTDNGAMIAYAGYLRLPDIRSANRVHPSRQSLPEPGCRFRGACPPPSCRKAMRSWERSRRRRTPCSATTSP